MTKTKTITEIYNETVINVDESVKFLAFSTDISLQEKKHDELLNLIPWIKRAKKAYADNEEEKEAKNFLYLQSAVYSLTSMLSCIINIKKNEFHDAWNNNIDAEEYIALGIRTAPNPEFLINLSKHRVMMEETLFPYIATYSSIGAITTGGKCNICYELYGNCNHVEGMIYKGKLCRQIDITDLEIDHTAIVKYPRDRRCIPLKIETSDNKWADIFTKLESEIPTEEDQSKVHQGTRISFVVFNNSVIDTD